MKTPSIELFFDLLKIAVGRNVHVSSHYSDKEWEDIYNFAKKQSLLAITLDAIDSSCKNNQKPPMPLLYHWIGEVEQIRQINRKVNSQCVQLTKWFSSRGIVSCILKGQGIAQLYPKPELRQAGDIDIWVNARRDSLVEIIRSEHIKITNVDYVDSKVSFFSDTEVEAHFRPTWMFNPFINRKVQAWIQRNKDDQMSNFDKEMGFAYPTIGFNLVFSFIHIYRHVFFEGIGLRQLMDYYFILTHSTKDERIEALATLQSFGLAKFAGTVMYIMRRVFNMDESLLLCEPNKDEGEFLLSEIMRGGNFGHFDDRNKYVSDEKRFLRGINNAKRNMRFLRRYPSEVIWMPFWKTWHWCWRKWNGYL